MSKRYLLAERTIDTDDLRDLIAWLETDPWLTQGPLVREFEGRWASWLGTRYATFVNSGSSADLLMYASLLNGGRLRNRRVVVPAVSWATTVAPAIQLGFEPVMCDANIDDFGCDLNHLEDLVRRHEPAAVIVVHVLGVPGRMDRLLALRDRYGFVLMEDACAAMGSTYRGRKVGTFGTLSAFSFFFGHHLSTIEGGMVCTDDDDLHDALLLLRSHGWAKDLAPEKEARRAEAAGAMEFQRPFTFYLPAFNLRSTDLNARLGLSQMKKIDRVVARRVENHQAYQSLFGDAAGFHCQRNDQATICSISFCALASSPAHRDRVAAALREKQVETRPIGGGNMSRQPYWAERFGVTEMPVADRIHRTGFQLPNHPGLSTDDVGEIARTVLAVAPE